MRRHASTVDRPRRVRCDGCGERIPNTRHPDLGEGEDHWCSLACLEGRSQQRPGTGERPLVADGGVETTDRTTVECPSCGRQTPSDECHWCGARVLFTHGGESRAE